MSRNDFIQFIASEMIREELGFPSYDKCLIVAEHIFDALSNPGYFQVINNMDLDEYDSE